MLKSAPTPAQLTSVQIAASVRTSFWYVSAARDPQVKTRDTSVPYSIGTAEDQSVGQTGERSEVQNKNRRRAALPCGGIEPEATDTALFGNVRSLKPRGHAAHTRSETSQDVPMKISQPTPEIPVPNARTARANYRDALSLEVAWRNGVGKIGAVTLGDCVVFFTEVAEEKPPSTFRVHC